MDIRKFQVFVMAAELGSFSKAGQKLGYSQSNVSYIIKSLEDEMGELLFNRSPQGITLNDAGEHIFTLAQELVSVNDRINHAISCFKGGASGNIRIAALPSIAIHWLPEILKSFEADYPSITFTIQTELTISLDKLLEDNVADVIFTTHLPHHTWRWIHLAMDPFMAVLPADYPVPAGRTFPVSHFSQTSFIMPNSGYGYAIQHILDDVKINSRIHYSSMDDATVLSLVEKGLGISILPRLVLKRCRQNVQICNLDQPIYRELGIARNAARPNTTETMQFIHYAKNIMRKIEW